MIKLSESAGTSDRVELLINSGDYNICLLVRTVRCPDIFDSGV